MTLAPMAVPVRSSSADDRAIHKALAILQTRFRTRDVFTHPDAVKNYLRLQSHSLTHEVFAVMYLDLQNRLIGYEPLFRGTLTHTSVHPREVLRQALAMNAASVILHHNHPTGLCEPTQADQTLTRLLHVALSLIEVELADHIITADDGACSMAERGLL